MSDGGAFVLGLVIVLAVLLLAGAFLTYLVVTELAQSEASSPRKIGWVPERDRLSTVRGAWRLFSAIWSRGISSDSDRRMARVVLALRCVHVVYFTLFLSLLIGFLVVVATAQ